MIAVSSAAFSTIATANRKFFFPMISLAVFGSSSPNMSMPYVCSVVAPMILPMPMESILTMPDSIGARKLVCGLTRGINTTASASAANLSMYTGMPSSSLPSSTTSMVARIGQPT